MKGEEYDLLAEAALRCLLKMAIFTSISGESHQEQLSHGLSKYRLTSLIM